MGEEERRDYVAQVEREAKGWEEKLDVVEREVSTCLPLFVYARARPFVQLN